MNTKLEKIEISVIIPEVILNSNEEIKSIYDIEKHTLNYPMLPTVPKEFYDQLQLLVPEFKPTEIVAFNPLMLAIGEMQLIKRLKWDVEKLDESERTYIDNNKLIGSFNSSLKTAKAILKEPHLEMNKKIEAIFKLFDNESTNTRNALEVNFKPLLDAREKAKAEKEAKLKAEETAKIAALTAENTKNNELFEKQKKDSRKFELEGMISALLTNVVMKLPSLNIAGLVEQKNSVEKVQFKMYFGPNDELLFEKLTEEIYFEELFKTTKKSTLTAIESQINLLETTVKLDQTVTENKILNASIPQLIDDDKDVPFVTPVNENTVRLTEKESFNLMVASITYIKIELEQQILAIESKGFIEPYIVSTQKKLLEHSFPQILDWISKTEVWAKDRESKYLEFINQQK